MELGKQLLFSAKFGDTDTVRDLMCRGAPFTTDWVYVFIIINNFIFIYNNIYNNIHNNIII